LVEIPVHLETEEERKQLMYQLQANALLESVRNGFCCIFGTTETMYNEY